MSAWALIVGGVAVEITSIDPAGRFPPDMQWEPCSSGVAEGWIYSGGVFSSPSAAAPTQAQLAAAVVSAGSAATGSIVSQIAPDATHQNAYQNAASMVWASGGAAPSSGPGQAIFASYAADFGVTPAVLASRVVAGSVGAIGLSGALLALEEAAATATTSAQLATALATFETTLTGIVSNLTATGLVVTAPAAISIPGVNA